MSNFNTAKIEELFKNIDTEKVIKLYNLIDYFFNIDSKNNITDPNRSNFKIKIHELTNEYKFNSFKILNYYLVKLMNNLKKIEKNANLNTKIKDENTRIGEIAYIINNIIDTIGIITNGKSNPHNRDNKSEKNLLVYTIINICKYIYRYDNICNKLIDHINNISLTQTTYKNSQTPEYFLSTLEYMRLNK